MSGEALAQRGKRPQRKPGMAEGIAGGKRDNSPSAVYAAKRKDSESEISSLKSQIQNLRFDISRNDESQSAKPSQPIVDRFRSPARASSSRAFGARMRVRSALRRKTCAAATKLTRRVDVVIASRGENRLRRRGLRENSAFCRRIERDCRKFRDRGLTTCYESQDLIAVVGSDPATRTPGVVDVVPRNPFLESR
jgi:hypothetical protein